MRDQNDELISSLSYKTQSAQAILSVATLAPSTASGVIYTPPPREQDL